MLLSDTMQIKFADLGLSKIIDSDKTHASTYVGTIVYMSPEVFHAQTVDENAVYYPNTDVWYMIQSFLFFSYQQYLLRLSIINYLNKGLLVVSFTSCSF